VSNTHLMGETTPDIVLDGYHKAVETGRELGIPVVAVTIANEMSEVVRSDGLDCPLVILRRVVLPPFDQQPRTRASGPLFAVS
jgi:hypothetical protein